VYRGGLYISNEMLYTTFGFTVRELWSFKDFSLALGMLSTTVNEAKSAQNCRKLPKFAQKRNFEIPLKIEFLVFFKNKNLYV
jgi:hypothetical protein